MKYWVSILIGIGLTLGLTRSTSAASLYPPDASCVYVTESGHNIHGPFLTFYLSHTGPENFGVPLTEAFTEGGYVVQYFTGGRLELHPENPGAYRVLLGLLGLEYGVADPPIKVAAVPSPALPNFRYFPNTGQMIGLTIKEFFDSHGGADVFGYPVSGLRYESGAFTQYFQRQRLEWRPMAIGSAQVRSSPVGQMVLDKKYASNFQWRNRAANDWCLEQSVKSAYWKVPPTPSRNLPSPTPVPLLLNLQVRVRFNLVGPTGPQLVDVNVDDQTGRPVSDVALYAIIHFANGDRVLPVLPTDVAGESKFQFDVGTQPPGSKTIVDVFAVAGSLGSVGRDIFTH